MNFNCFFGYIPAVNSILTIIQPFDYEWGAGVLPKGAAESIGAVKGPPPKPYSKTLQRIQGWEKAAGRLPACLRAGTPPPRREGGLGPKKGAGPCGREESSSCSPSECDRFGASEDPESGYEKSLW